MCPRNEHGIDGMDCLGRGFACDRVALHQDGLEAGAGS